MKNVNFQTGAIVAKTVSHYSSPEAVATIANFDATMTAGACSSCSSGVAEAKTISHYSSPQAVATVSEFDESLTAGACTCCSSSCGIVE
ncbi:hypothetical protein D1816_15020 [Aquimarina sp. AD10]|uniref:Uncharacterized protein n=1 Tax=Aquimarina aggregata TaxID=1642818 RepID=A0A162WHA8_9FLAO|nr:MULTISPECIES: hypothetical protein [Aquimarina]AXT61606.1 hypothetical protein D1816_15020 [Aquimarina sp. AD10]KZS38100.1 hypothetical protein AWE51_18820 [Aquimarina aggregata]RKN01046.1 hypothetical protein D7033_06745 [Aquimarina sp. AD10]